jgi:type II secretory pathway component PulF
MESSVFFSLLWLCAVLLPIFLFGPVVYILLSLPMRRAERARFFFDMLEQGIRAGRTPEQTIASIAGSRDRSLGVRFYLVAAHIESGCRFGEALDKVPRFLPPQINAMLKAGETIGDLPKVLPACKSLLQDGISETRGGINYLILFALVFTPAAPVIFNVLVRFVFPKFALILSDMEIPVPRVTGFVLSQSGTIANILIAGALLIDLVILAYVGGPRLASWLRWRSFPLADWLAYQLPWKRKRMLRNFGAMTGVLLDLDIPESRALTLAATGAANLIFEKRVQRVVAALGSGRRLVDALQELDQTGEFAWRLKNASHRSRNVRASLSGWLESLDAKAFQQQQAAAQFMTSALVILNGLLVGVFIIGAFSGLVSVIDAGVLW